jgi:hypothetical protein
MAATWTLDICSWAHFRKFEESVST